MCGGGQDEKQLPIVQPSMALLKEMRLSVHRNSVVRNKPPMLDQANRYSVISTGQEPARSHQIVNMFNSQRVIGRFMIIVARADQVDVM